MYQAGFLKSSVRLSLTSPRSFSEPILLKSNHRELVNKARRVEVLFLDPCLHGDVDTSAIPDEELREAEKFKNQEVQKEKLLSRLCLRSTLAGHLGVDPKVRRWP